MPDSLAAQTALTFGGLLGVALAAVIAAERGRLDRLRASVLFTRWRTWVAITILFVPAVLGGRLPLAVLVAGVSTLALAEYGRLTRIGGRARDAMVVAGWVVVGVTAAAPGVPMLPALAGALGAIALVARGRPAVAAAGLVYVPLALAHAVAIASGPGGPALLLAIGLAVAMSDVGAFTVGSLLRGPRLAPRLSPGKRWSGVLGNVAGAAAGLALAHATFLDAGVPLLVALAMTTPVAAVLGDLLESALKRRAGVKDAGDTLPGFGGVLDRIDSLIAVFPATFYVALALR